MRYPGREWTLNSLNGEMDSSKSLTMCANYKWSFLFAFGKTEPFLWGIHHSRLLVIQIQSRSVFSAESRLKPSITPQAPGPCGLRCVF